MNVFYRLVFVLRVDAFGRCYATRRCDLKKLAFPSTEKMEEVFELFEVVV